MSSFSDRLRQLRGPSSQAEMAKELGMLQQQYARYEKGITVPSIDVLSKICRIHACSSDWILGLERRPSSTSVNVRGDGNAVATGPNAKVSVVTTAQSNCKTCPYKAAVKRLQKAGMTIEGV